MKEIILHHYPQSPVSEKVRVGLGLKDLEWASVEVPRLPPKLDLTALTGGYRRAPVMQIGADVFCDSHCILRELQCRFPEPSFTPNGAAGLSWGVGRWIDAEPFDMAVRLVLGAGAAELPREFLDDRSRLYFGPDRDLDAIQANLPHLAAQLRVHLGLIAESLADGRCFLLGDRPGLADIFCYYLVWFTRGRWAGGPALLAQFAALEAWETKVAALGHGCPVAASAGEALEAARRAEPRAPRGVDPHDPLTLNAGQRVAIRSAFDDGEDPVEGTVRYADANTIVIDREDPRVGNIAVHFPRAGYRIMPTSAGRH